MNKFKEIDIFQYVKLNFFSKNVIHKGNGKIIPFTGAHVDLGEGSRLILHDGNIEIGVNKIKGSKAETLIRLRRNAEWNVKSYCSMSYGTTIEINENAILESGSFTSNSNTVLVINKNVSIGNDVMLGRNVVIYDSDFHSLKNKEISEPLYIGDHVWVATNSTILKGVRIEKGSVIAAGTIISKDVSEYVLVGNDAKQIILSENTEWKRQ